MNLNIMKLYNSVIKLAKKCEQFINKPIPTYFDRYRS